MANGTGAAVGGVAGGVLGLVGSLISSYENRAIQTRARRRQRGAIEEARRFADERVAAVRQGDVFRKAESFLSRTFDDTQENPLLVDAAKRLAVAQSERGAFFGNAPALEAAGGASAYLQQFRASLLPSALQFAEAPERLRQDIFGSEAALRAAAATGAPIAGAPNLGSPIFGPALENTIAGAAGGFQLGRDYDQGVALAQATEDRARQERQFQESQNIASVLNTLLTGGTRRRSSLFASGF